MTDTVYAEAAELRAQPDSQITGQDDVLNVLLAAASRAVDGYCNRPDGFVAEDTATARVYAGNGCAHVWIDECIAVTAVAVKTSVTTTTYTAWSAADWVTFRGDPARPNFNRTPYHGLLVLPSGSHATFLNGGGLPTVQVTAKWGYAEVVPPAVKQATITLAARWFKRGADYWADTIGNADYGTKEYRKVIDPDVAFMLKMGRFIRK